VEPLSAVDSRHQTLHKPSAQNATAPLPPNYREPQTIAHQKAMSKALAMTGWQARFHNAGIRSQAFLALPVAPNGKLPPAIQSAVGSSCTAAFTVKRA
jgi:hypothetical protein